MRERFAIHLILAATLAALATVGGCGWNYGIREPESFSILGADDESVLYYQYAEQPFSTFSPPRSLWRLDTTTGIASQLTMPSLDWPQQVGHGDYYVCVEDEDGASLQRVVGVQISTGDRFAIAEYVDVGPHGLDLVLNASILVMQTDSKIELFDLNTRMDEPKLKQLLSEPSITDFITDGIKGSTKVKGVDWIIARGLRFADCGSVQTDASDHPLVWAELELPAAPPRTADGSAAKAAGSQDDSHAVDSGKL